MQTKLVSNKKRKFTRKIAKEWSFCYLFLIYPLALFAIFYVYVNVNSFVMAFQRINIDGTRDFIGFDNFATFFKSLTAEEGLLKISFWNSIIKFLIGNLVALPLQLLFSYMLFKKCFANRLIRILVMMPSIISSYIFTLVFRNFAGAPLQSFMQLNMGLKNFPNLMDDSRYVFGTTVFYTIWVSFSTSLIIYPNAMRSIDPAIFESAKIDGMCTIWQELWYIILPLIFPTLTTFLVLGVAAIFTDSGPLIAFYMYESPPEAYNMGYYLTVQVFNNSNPIRFPGVAAGGMILTLIIAPLTLLTRWYLEKINPVQEA